MMGSMASITLRQLQYFCAVATQGSISAAAQQELVSRSAISSALDELERSLQATLCTRTKAQGIELTAAGRYVFDRALSVLHEVEELQGSADRTELAGGLAVGCFPSLAPTLLPALFEHFSEHHPKVQLELVTADRESMVAQALAGDLDLLLAYNLHHDRRLRTVTLYDTVMYLVLSPDHRLAGRPVVDAQDLEGESMILLDVAPSVDDVLGYFTRQGITPDIVLRTAHYELIRSLVARGVGCSVFIQHPRNNLSYEGRPLVARPLSPRPHSQRAVAAWPAGRALSARARRFVEVAQEGAAVSAPPQLYPPGPGS